jgi:pimeloyl-ACP methyl ester carboxylesterase
MQDAATTDFVLIPGAGGQGWYWHLVQAELVRRGHRAVAVDLPGADPAAGLLEYRDLIVAAARTFAGPVTLVALSLGGFSAPLACEHVSVERLILVNAMIPRPGEPAGEWWDNVGWQAEAQAAADRDGRQKIDVNDLETLFFHDLPAPLVEQMRANREAADESPAIFGQPWPLAVWPPVPTEVLSGRDDRFFPPSLQRRVARERLSLEVREIPGGHLAALSHPVALADHLVGRGPTPGA